MDYTAAIRLDPDNAVIYVDSIHTAGTLGAIGW
jgi:hypothetical protein